MIVPLAQTGTFTTATGAVKIYYVTRAASDGGDDWWFAYQTSGSATVTMTESGGANLALVGTFSGTFVGSSGTLEITQGTISLIQLQ